MLGAIAQLETELRAERQREAIQNARARGVTGGRTKRLTSQQSLELWNHRQQGAPIKTLMADYGLSKSSVYRYLSGPSSAPTATAEKKNPGFPCPLRTPAAAYQADERSNGGRKQG
jgi:DNA invertase Pin-like site-specific DNA recombinase